jgi:hypothetical protein
LFIEFLSCGFFLAARRHELSRRLKLDFGLQEGVGCSVRG